MRICYCFPSRSRPERFFKALNNIQDMSASKDYFVCAKLDTDDVSMNNEDVRDRLLEYPEVTVKWGESKGKVHAVNRSMEDLPPCDILIIMSDDIQWDVYGFDDEIREAFKKYSPNFESTVHWPDDHGGKNTIIVSIVGINLYRKLGYLYYPDYESVFADNDFTEMTRMLNKYVFVNKRLFSHLHPIWQLADWDAQYRHSERPDVYQRDGALFAKRKAINFGL